MQFLQQPLGFKRLGSTIQPVDEEVVTEAELLRFCTAAEAAD